MGRHLLRRCWFVICALVPGGKIYAEPAARRPSVVTALDVAVADDEQDRPSCDGVKPRRVDVLVDGKAVGHVDIPCTTEIRAPARRFDVRVAVAPGRHVLRVVDRRSRRAGTLTEWFPKLVPLGDGRAIADRVDVDVGVDGVRLGAVGLADKAL